MANNDRFVVRHEEGWAVKKTRAGRSSSVHPTQKEAEQRAKEIAPLRAISTPHPTLSISSVEWASGSMLNRHPRSRPRSHQRQSKSSRHEMALSSMGTPCLAQAVRIFSMSTS